MRGSIKGAAQAGKRQTRTVSGKAPGVSAGKRPHERLRRETTGRSVVEWRKYPPKRNLFGASLQLSGGMALVAWEDAPILRGSPAS